jgi:L-rhamnose mutarotase
MKLKKTKNPDKIWYNPKHPAGYAGVSKLQAVTQKSKKKTQKWLREQLAYSLHKPMRKRFPTRAYKTFGINDLWQMDLMEMIPYSSINNGYKYILTCIDVFSRFARAIPLKTKSATETQKAIEVMMKKEKPKHVQTDLGKEFYNSKVSALFKKLSINHYSVFSQFKAALVERFNRTLRERLNKHFTAQGNKKWLAVLPEIIDSYNNSGHRGLKGLKPIDVTNKNTMKLWASQNIKAKPKKPKYKVGDYVRISKISASPFIKNFNQNWSDEVFKISKINTSQSPVMYVIKDDKNEVVQGKFYEQELQVIDKPKIFRIQKILKSKGKGKYKQYYVKWHGYSTPSWILASQIV